MVIFYLRFRVVFHQENISLLNPWIFKWTLAWSQFFVGTELEESEVYFNIMSNFTEVSLHTHKDLLLLVVHVRTEKKTAAITVSGRVISTW